MEKCPPLLLLSDGASVFLTLTLFIATIGTTLGLVFSLLATNEIFNTSLQTVETSCGILPAKMIS